jgi:hypothetical protein
MYTVISQIKEVVMDLPYSGGETENPYRNFIGYYRPFINTKLFTYSFLNFFQNIRINCATFLSVES